MYPFDRGFLKNIRRIESIKIISSKRAKMSENSLLKY